MAIPISVMKWEDDDDPDFKMTCSPEMSSPILIPTTAGCATRTRCNWNEAYALWVITRHDDLVLADPPSRAVLVRRLQERSTAPPYPDINESDLGLYE